MLHGSDLDNLTRALVDAFRSEVDLERMVRVRLNERLRAIVGGDGLDELAFRLVEWADARGRLVELVSGALAHNFLNLELRRVAESAFNRDRYDVTFRARLADLQKEHPDDLWIRTLLNPRRSSGPTIPPEAPATVVYLRGVRARSLLQALTLRAGGVFCDLPGGDSIAWFILSGALDLDYRRAVALAQDVTAPRLADACAVASGVLRNLGGVPSGDAVERARVMSARGGLHVDAEVARRFRSTPPPVLVSEGVCRIDAPRPHSDSISPAVTTPLRGRAEPLSTLVSAVSAAAASRTLKSVAVLGLPGMGKSRLRRAAFDRLNALGVPAVHVVIRGDANLRDAPFGALKVALEPLVGRGIAETLCDRDDADGDPSQRQDQRDARFRMFAELLRALTRYGPLVLALEDANLFDEATRGAVRWVGEHCVDQPLTVWVFARSNDPGFRPDDVAPGCGDVRTLEALDDDDAAALLRDVLGDAPRSILDRSGGNPLFLVELARLYAERGDAQSSPAASLPLSIHACFGEHLSMLDASAHAFVRVAAVFGRRFWVEAVEAIVGPLAPKVLSTLVTTLLRRRSPSRFEGLDECVFQSDVCREAAYGRIDPFERAKLHGLAAAWLQARPEATAAELARHFDLGFDVSNAARCYARSASLLARTATVATTCEHANRVIELATLGLVAARDQWTARVARDDVRMLTDRQQERWEDIEALQTLALDLDADHVAEAAWRECHCARLTNDRERALRAGARARDRSAAGASERWHVLVHIELAKLFYDAGRTEEAREAQAALQRYVEGAPADEWLGANVYRTLAYLLADVGNANEAIRLNNLAARGFRRSRDVRKQTIALVNVAYAQIRLGHLKGARETLDAVIILARGVDNDRTVAVATHNLGLIARIEGELTEAFEAFERAASSASRLAHSKLLAEIAIDRTYLAMQRGAPSGEVVVLAQRARALVAGQARNLQCAALAVTLRACALDGRDVTEERREAERLLAETDTPVESQTELALALLAIEGRWAAPARALIERLVEQACPDSPARAQECRAVCARRYLAPAVLSVA